MSNEYTKHHWRKVASGHVTVPHTAKDLWDRAIEYFEDCDNNPIIRKSKTKSGREAGKEIDEELPRAYNYRALCLYCGCEEEWLEDILERKDKTSEWYQVVSRIDLIIKSQLFELGAVGELNPIFVTKVLELDKEVTNNRPVVVEHVGGLPPMASSENEILEKLDYGKPTLESIAMEIPTEQFAHAKSE